jgi:hypothetical protein
MVDVDGYNAQYHFAMQQQQQLTGGLSSHSEEMDGVLL